MATFQDLTTEEQAAFNEVLVRYITIANTAYATDRTENPEVLNTVATDVLEPLAALITEGLIPNPTNYAGCQALSKSEVNALRTLANAIHTLVINNYDLIVKAIGLNAGVR